MKAVQTSNDFIGFNVVRHRHRPNPEDCFHFVRRHTFGRPRDLVIIASDISARRTTMDEGRLSRIVHELSSSSLINNIFAEVQVLLDCLGDEQSRMRLFDLLPTSILSRAEAVRICESYNGLDPGALDQLGVNAPDIYHPFRDLFVAGLLGIIEVDPEKGMSYQRFRQPKRLSIDQCSFAADVDLLPASSGNQSIHQYSSSRKSLSTFSASGRRAWPAMARDQSLRHANREGAVSIGE